MNTPNILKVALAQISPVWLDKTATTEKLENCIIEAGEKDIINKEE